MVGARIDDATGTADGTARPAVYYDGGCPLCSAEIATYRNCRGADAIDWIDVSAPADGGDCGIVAPGLTRQDALRRFHMRRADGTLVSGGAAFAELWACLPALSWAGRIARRRPFRVLLEAAYRVFLPLRPRLQRWLLRRQRHRTTARTS